ncbi:DMT family transporter [Clostridium sp. YIM B02551]|uniref:DMT family transporter n=1 Tax=Clostridium sp. YIM B02551 TaxID=2910679 RepID=UPI001EECB620|nr:DMT family transporter [Clostridium sp. YIM B02551]
MKNKRNYTDWKFVGCVAAICCILWGSAYPGVKNGYILFNIATNDIASKYVFAGYRFTISGVILLIFSGMFGKKVFKLSKEHIKGLIILSILQTMLQYIFFYVGVANTTGVKSAILNATGTFFSVILAHYIYKDDKLSKGKVIGCLVGFIGVMIVNFSSNLIDFSFKFMGEGFIVISAFVSSVAAIYAKKLTKEMDVIIVTGYSLFIGGLMLILLGATFGGRVYHFTLPSSSLLLYLALLSSIAFSLWNLLLKYNKVGKVSIYNFLTPVFGALFSSIFLGENIFEVKNVIALFLVCLGIWSVNRT